MLESGNVEGGLYKNRLGFLECDVCVALAPLRCKIWSALLLLLVLYLNTNGG